MNEVGDLIRCIEIFIFVELWDNFNSSVFGASLDSKPCSGQWMLTSTALTFCFLFFFCFSNLPCRSSWPSPPQPSLKLLSILLSYTLLAQSRISSTSVLCPLASTLSSSLSYSQSPRLCCGISYHPETLSCLSFVKARWMCSELRCFTIWYTMVNRTILWSTIW